MLLREDGEPWKKNQQCRPLNQACDLAKLRRIGINILRPHVRRLSEDCGVFRSPR